MGGGSIGYVNVGLATFNADKQNQNMQTDHKAELLLNLISHLKTNSISLQFLIAVGIKLCV